ncbi:MAG: hypothetical protein A2144_08170 [Chloroflexi bacterium RBG_16_50_9]|nr:MAG: hypothetical protein A2144_08170 [Chloroflexi bacterium RBG_16_50_9]
MTTGKANHGWALLIIFLVAIIAAGSVIIWSKYQRSPSIEIFMVPEPELPDVIYVDGEVNNAGLYPLAAGDSIREIIQAAGGTTDNADLNRLRLYVSGVTVEGLPQKININRAELWLLEALPGIGEVRAKAIIDYRQQNGTFRHINELLKVEGIGAETYNNIRHLITVAD